MNNKPVIIDGDFVDAIVGVHVFYNDSHKVALWLNTDNMNFGGCKPVDLLLRGRAKKVAQMVNNALEEGGTIKPPRKKKPC
jgi:hypothetical protein